MRYSQDKMKSKVSIKKYFERILKEKDKALKAALIANEKRLDLLNELRSGVATKDQLEALEKVVEDLKVSRASIEGKGEGYKQFLGWIVAGVTIFGIIAGLAIKYFTSK